LIYLGCVYYYSVENEGSQVENEVQRLGAENEGLEQSDVVHWNM